MSEAGAPRERPIPAPETSDRAHPSVGTDDVHASNHSHPEGREVFWSVARTCRGEREAGVRAPRVQRCNSPRSARLGRRSQHPEPAVGTDMTRRMSRLAKTEISILPDFHVQTVAACGAGPPRSEAAHRRGVRRGRWPTHGHRRRARGTRRGIRRSCSGSSRHAQTGRGSRGRDAGVRRQPLARAPLAICRSLT